MKCELSSESWAAYFKSSEMGKSYILETFASELFASSIINLFSTGRTGVIPLWSLDQRFVIHRDMALNYVLVVWLVETQNEAWLIP